MYLIILKSILWTKRDLKYKKSMSDLKNVVMTRQWREVHKFPHLSFSWADWRKTNRTTYLWASLLLLRWHFSASWERQASRNSLSLSLSLSKVLVQVRSLIRSSQKFSGGLWGAAAHNQSRMCRTEKSRGQFSQLRLRVKWRRRWRTCETRGVDRHPLLWPAHWNEIQLKFDCKVTCFPSCANPTVHYLK